LPVVYDYASSTGDSRLLLNCAWKTQDWSKVRQLCSSSALLPAMEDGDPNVKMGEILLAINEGKLGDVKACMYRQLSYAYKSGSSSLMCQRDQLYTLHYFTLFTDWWSSENQVKSWLKQAIILSAGRFLI